MCFRSVIDRVLLILSLASGNLTPLILHAAFVKKHFYEFLYFVACFNLFSITLSIIY